MSTSTRSYGTSTFQNKPAVPSPFVSYAPISLNNRNSTSSSCSQSSSGFESAKTPSNVATSNSTASFNSNSCVSDGSHANSTESMPKSSPYAASQCSNRHSSAGSDTSSRPRSQCAQFTSSSCNIGEMIARGISDSEILAEWLERLDMQKYLAMFITQGYDVQSVARLTSEDLLGLGITNPTDRRKVHSSIQEWKDVNDTWPTNVQPEDNSAGWLLSIGLQQYIRLFESEGYMYMKDLESLNFEDLEEIGIKKLGHIKRIMLALRKLKQARIQYILAGRKPSTSAAQFHSPDSGYTDISGSSISTAQRPRAPSQGFDCRRSVVQPAESDYATFKNPSFGAEVDPYNMPKLRLFTTQEILSNTTDLPRSINGEIMSIPHLSSFGPHRSAPPPPPAPMPTYHQSNRLPAMPQSGRLNLTPSYEFETSELNSRHGRSLHGSPLSARGPYASQPATPARHLTSFITTGCDTERVRDKLCAMGISK